MRVNVFKEYPFGLNFPDNARDFRPEVARVLFGELLTSAGERLARIARCDRPDLPAVRLTVEGSEIAPNIRRMKGAVREARDQPFDDSDFPFHEHDCSSFRNNKL